MNNPAAMGQPVPHPGGPPMPQGQPQGPPTGASMMSVPGAPVNPAVPLTTRQAQNEDILKNCLFHTQRLREHLEALLNTTKQAALMDSEDAGATSSGQGNAAAGGNQGPNSATSSMKNLIDQKLLEMNTSLEFLGQSLEQYDFKLFQNQQAFINYYNELAHEKQGTMIDDWSSNTKWANRLSEMVQTIVPSVNVYRRSNPRNTSALSRSRLDGPSAAIVERLVAQLEQSSGLSTGQFQAVPGGPTKDYSLTCQRLSDNLSIVEMILYRSGLDVYLYLRQCTVEHVVVKPLNEKKQFGNHLPNKNVSNYQALKRIEGHIQAAAAFHTANNHVTDQGLQKTADLYLQIQSVTFPKMRWLSKTFAQRSSTDLERFQNVWVLSRRMFHLAKESSLLPHLLDL